MRALGSNKNRKISAAGFFHQIADTQVEVLKIFPKGTISQAVTGTPVEVPNIKNLKKYIDAAENNFKINLDYSLRQQVIKLFDFDKKNLSSTHGSGMYGLYTAPPASR